MESDHSENKGARLPVPLTRANKDGKRYKRLPEVDNQIWMALDLEPEELVIRATVSDKSSPDFLKEEALVYLIRHYHREEDRGIVAALTEVLLGRFASWVESRLRTLGDEAVNDGYTDVVTRLFIRILDIDSNRGDFLQVRFWLVLKRLTVRAFNEQLKHVNRKKSNNSLESIAGYEGGNSDEAGYGWMVKPSDSVTCRSAESQATDNIFIRQAMSQLKEPFRSAYLLRHYHNWPIENQDPAVPTISQRFGKTPRTIRNWLTKADEELSVWLGAQKNE